MKIGIMTYHYYNNYGTVLQALALQIALKKLGYTDADIIDYRTSDPAVISALSGIAYNRIPLYDNSEYAGAYHTFKEQIATRAEKFEDFRNAYLKVSKRCDYDSIKSDPPYYDIYLSGGDQIWNTITRDYRQNAPYMLDFTDSPNKIAYGSGMYRFAFPMYSQKKHRFTYKVEDKYIQLLNKYKVITVREYESLWTLSNYLTNVEGVVLDTSLLPFTEDYDNHIKTPKCTDVYGKQFDPTGGYIFVYNLDLNERDLLDTLVRASKSTGKKVCVISSDIPLPQNDRVQTLLEISPSEWLWLVKNADLILTNSFHGMTYSILFEKQFAAVTADFRKLTSLSLLKFSGRHIFKRFFDIPITELETIDYSVVTASLKNERERCLRFLQNAVAGCLI